MVELSEARAELDAVLRREIVGRLEASARRSMAKFFVDQGRIAERLLRPLRSEFREAPGADEIDAWVFRLSEETNDELLRLVRVMISQAMTEGMDTQAAFAAAFGIDLQRQDPRSVFYLDQVAAARVTRINETTREAMKRLIGDSIRNNESYSTIAKRIRETFDGFAGAKPQQHIRDRATLVAVTEIGDAYEESRLIASRQMQEAGLLMEKRWITVGDDRVSDGCRANQAQGWLRLSDPFASGHERPLRFPGCRCTSASRVALDQAA